jgi:hypothetical protein
VKLTTQVSVEQSLVDTHGPARGFFNVNSPHELTNYFLYLDSQ